MMGASGKDVLAAMLAGYEAMIRVSLATGPNASRLKGWHLTGTFGAAAAAGNLLGLNEDDMASALGMAGTQSAGLWAFTAEGAMSKRFHPGRASQSGVMAALLAREGFLLVGSEPSASVVVPPGQCRPRFPSGHRPSIQSWNVRSSEQPSPFWRLPASALTGHAQSPIVPACCQSGLVCWAACLSPSWSPPRPFTRPRWPKARRTTRS
jgi:hypothetical protein